MNALFGRSNETNTDSTTNTNTNTLNHPSNTQQPLHANKDADLARREHAGPEEEDDIHRTQQHQQGGISGLAHRAEDAVKNTVRHVKEKDVVVEKPAVVNEVVHDKNIHVVQPVVNRQVEVEHVKHHRVEHAQHEGKRTIDEGVAAGVPAGYQAGTHGTSREGGILKRHGSSSSSSSSSDDEKRGRVGTTHRKTGATTTGAGLTGHHATGTTGTGVTGHNVTGTTAGTGLTGHGTTTTTGATTTGAGLTGHHATGTTGTGVTGHNATGTTGTGLTGHGTTTTTGATTTHGTSATAPHEKKSMGEKIKEVFTGHH